MRFRLQTVFWLKRRLLCIEDAAERATDSDDVQYVVKQLGWINESLQMAIARIEDDRREEMLVDDGLPITWPDWFIRARGIPGDAFTGEEP